MNILVCISNVPDTTTKVTFANNDTEFNTAGVQYILNPYDEIALSKAIELTEGGKGKVTVIHVGDVSTEPTIRKALATGADDAVRVNTSPIDGLFVAKQIAAYAKDKAFDMILTGRESIDYNNGQVAGFLGALLNIASVSVIKSLSIEGSTAVLEREIEGGKEVIGVNLPFIASCAEGVAEPRIPNMRGIMSARTKPLQVIEPVAEISPIKTIRFETPSAKSAARIFSADEADKLIEALHSEAKVL